MCLQYRILQTALFQLTTSRGGRQQLQAYQSTATYFNSRPHEEVDDGCTAICIRHTTFQLTTSRGGRPLRHNPGPKFLSISTHDLTRRSTGRNRSRSRKEIFQLTTSQGGRLHRLSDRLLLHYFNSRPRKEVDIIPCERQDIQQAISTHDLARRSTAMIMVDTMKNEFQLTTSQGGRQQFLRKKFSFQNHFLCSLHIIYSYYINIVFFSTLFLAKSSFFLVRIP